MADAADLKSAAPQGRRGSSPLPGTFIWYAARIVAGSQQTYEGGADERLHPATATPGSPQVDVGPVGSPEVPASAIRRLSHEHFGASDVLALQRTVGNRQVGKLLTQRSVSRSVVQRDGDDGTAGITWGEQVDGTYNLSPPLPIPVPPDAVGGGQGPGDYPTPDPNKAMAKHDLGSATIQRDDPKPGMSADGTAGVQAPLHTPPGGAAPAPFTFTGTVLIRDANIVTFGFKNPIFTGLDLGHEPSWTWSFDSKGVVQQQLGITLINTHWMPPWGKEIEVGLSGFFQSTVFPHNSSPLAPGGQLQVEQHLIVPWFSVTLSASGVYDSASGQMATTGGINLLFHAPTLKRPPPPPAAP
jgi:hypothetical protein